jgi:mandelamide amidase
VLRELYRAYFRDNDVVAMVFPTTPLPCSLIGDREVTVNGVNVPTFATFIRNTEPGSVAGIPGISIPAATTSAGLPIGLELDAPESADRDLLALARAIESVLPNQSPPPRPRSAIDTTT